MNNARQNTIFKNMFEKSTFIWSLDNDRIRLKLFLAPLCDPISWLLLFIHREIIYARASGWVITCQH